MSNELNQSLNYRWSDAWLLEAIVIASQRRPASICEIIAAGDALNHAIFSPEEFESGLARLSQGGWIEENEEGFIITAKFSCSESFLQKFGKYFRVLKPRYDKIIKKLLRVLPPKADDPTPHPDNNLQYNGFSNQEFFKAVNKYLEELK